MTRLFVLVSSESADVRTLFEQGLSQRAIARQLRLSRKTVRTFIRAEAYPEANFDLLRLRVLRRA